MKLADVLNSDLRKEGTSEELQRFLKKIPVFEKINGDVPFVMLEKALWKIMKKYGFQMQYIMPSYINVETPFYSCSFKRKGDNEWIGSVFGMTIYEVFAKGVLMCYAKRER